MNHTESEVNQKIRQEFQNRIFGVVVGIITNNQDPDELGRVKINLPWLSEDYESDWIRICSFMAGGDRGGWFLPEVDDEVLVAFEHGDVRLPYVIGSLWNGQDTPPETNSDGENNLRLIKTRSGHVIKFDDTNGSEKIEVIDKTGNNSIIIDSSENKITIQSDGDLELVAQQGKIKFDAESIELKSSAETKIEAGSDANVEASATMTIKGQTVNIN